VESSKYKYLLGTPSQPTECIGGIAIGSVSPDSNVIKANNHFIAIPWKLTGTVGIVPITNKGALPEEVPLITQEDGINEIAFNPFDDHVIATAGQDGSARLYRIPEGGLTKDITEPIATFTAHSKRLMFVDYHPLVRDILLTATNDEVKMWDVSTGVVARDFPSAYKGQLTSVSWNYTGAVCATASKDKALRIVDPRASNIVAEVQAHTGAKGFRAVWCGRKEAIVSIGFTKTAEREISLWDPRRIGSPVFNLKLDNSPAAPMPFYDNDTGVLYVGAKGEGTIKLYEVTDTALTYLSDYKSPTPASGMSMLPKKLCDPMKCEVAKCVKITSAGLIIPIRFEVPRSNMNLFHDDLYPDTYSGKPTLEAQEWLSGVDREPELVPVKPN